MSIFDLTGRTALVTGGSKGLGMAMARGLAEAGPTSPYAAAMRRIDERHATPSPAPPAARRSDPADMTKRDDVKRLADEATRRLGKVDILVNNAGTNMPQAIDAITDETWDSLIELNLTSVMALTRALVPRHEGAAVGPHHPHLVDDGLISKEKRNAYSATKAALIGMARASALELGRVQRSQSIAWRPGPFLTDLPASLCREREAVTSGAE